MDTRNWFGQHAHTVRIFALIGGVVLAAIILVDIMTQKAKAGAASATTTPNASASTAPTSSLNPGETNISVFEDYSTHNGSDVTSNQYAAPVFYPGGRPGGPPHGPAMPASGASGPVVYPGGGPGGPPHGPAMPAAHQGGPVPVTAPHPATVPSATPNTYTVKRGDSLWSIAAAKLGSGFDWQELYNWNRSTVGSNPNLIYPGEVLTLN